MCDRCLRELKEMDVESSRLIFADFDSQMNEAILMGACEWSVYSHSFSDFHV